MHLSGVRPSVCPYVCPIYRSLQQRAAGLLQAGDIDRQPRAAPRRSAANASSVVSRAALEG